MRNRGKPLALLGLPHVAAIAIVVVLVSPGPVPGETATGSSGAPGSTGTIPPGIIAAGSTRPGQATEGATVGNGAASAIPSQPGSTAAATAITPAGSPTAAPTNVPTTVPASSPTFRPTAAPTIGPTTAPPPSAAPTPTAGPIPPLSACPILPSGNVWNRRVDGLPVAANSVAMTAAIGLSAGLHPDFSNAGGYGIPFNVVGTSTPRSSVSFQYDDESDHVGYPIPASPKIEAGSDRHILMIDTNDCVLYELFAAAKSGASWSAGSGAVWDLGSNALRADGWTSADAAGLPIFPGLVRWSEVAGGAIRHAIRFTAPQTCDGYIYPARHEAGNGSCSTYPPMGLRVRLKASVDTSGFGPQSRVILTALKEYGMLLADNGSPWYITGAPDSHWDDDELHDLGQLTGSDFEVVDTTGFINQ
ncbi:MAG: hypothetical protein EPO36_00255 [Chloroflexota bacterium]|nr:MAG: hypothetical protein EPO36_00255 [Chloroflexota bacterium]